MAKPVELVCCFAREDEEDLRRLQKHLMVLKNEGLLNSWDKGQIELGMLVEKVLEQHFHNAQLIIVLISPDFLASCQTEMERALELQLGGKGWVVPVLLRPVLWQTTEWSTLQSLPRNGKPVSLWSDPDEAFFLIAQEIKHLTYAIYVQQLLQEGRTYSKAGHYTDALATYSKAIQLKPDLGQAYFSQWHIYTRLADEAKKRAVSLMYEGPLKLARILQEHTEPVWCVAISFDGKTLASGSEDHTIKLWSLSIAQQPRTLHGHTGAVVSTAFLRKKNALVSGSEDCTIRLWSLSNDQELYAWRGHTNTVHCLAVCSDDSTLVSGSADYTIKMWDLTTGKLLRTLTGHQDVIMSLAICSDDNTLISGSADHTIKVWDLTTGKLLRTLTGHQGVIMSLAICSDDNTLISGSQDDTIKVWNLSSGRTLRTLHGNTSAIYCLALCPDGNTVISGSEDSTLKVWDLSASQEWQELVIQKGSAICDLAISQDCRILASGNDDGMIRIWNCL
jgi:WD40 repeat protein